MNKLILAVALFTAFLVGGTYEMAHGTTASTAGSAHFASISASVGGQGSGASPDGFSWG